MMPDQSACHLAALGHASLIAAAFMGPFSIVIPLIIWLSERQKPSPSAWLIFQSKQAFFYQAAVFIILILASLLVIILSAFIIGFFLIPVLSVLGLAAMGYAIFAAVQAWQGQPFRYWMLADFLDLPGQP